MSLHHFEGGGGGSGPHPSISRDSLIAVETRGMQGLMLHGKPMLDWYLTSPDLTAADRREYYTIKQDAQDTHCIIPLSWNYPESGAYAPTGFDGWQNFSRLDDLISEVVDAGFHVPFMCAGDGIDPAQGSIYSDPQGWTYGWQWLMDHFDQIYDQITAKSSIIWTPGFDGCIPAWAGPENNWHRTNQWIQKCRSVIGPTGVLFLYLIDGYWAWSGETNDYATPDGQEVDGVFYEGPIPFGPPDPYPGADSGHSWDAIWQISKRLLREAYVRPPDQPADDDPGSISGRHLTPRGPMMPVFLEFATYPWVRPGHISLEQVQWQRSYLKNLGWPHVG